MLIKSRSILDKELNHLQTNVLRLSSMVQESIQRAIDALINRDIDLANRVVAYDQSVNELRYALEQECLQIIATQQPAAGDLRMVLAVIHIVVELERIGDHAAGIAALVKRMEQDDEIESLHQLPKMATRVIDMIQLTSQAFVKQDEALAFSVIALDDKVDRQYRKLFRKAVQEMSDDAYIRRATFLMWVGHDLERIGDRATNIAERVIFMITGKYIEVDDYEPKDEDDDEEDE
jgi:phosphate transport system protein